jgi:hypothetical protein
MEELIESINLEVNQIMNEEVEFQKQKHLNFLRFCLFNLKKLNYY